MIFEGALIDSRQNPCSIHLRMAVHVDIQKCIYIHARITCIHKMHAKIDTYIYICMYTYLRIHLCTCRQRHGSICAHIHVIMNTCTYTHMYKFIYIYTYMCIYIFKYIFRYIYVYVHLFTFVFLCLVAFMCISGLDLFVHVKFICVYLSIQQYVLEPWAPCSAAGLGGHQSDRPRVLDESWPLSTTAVLLTCQQTCASIFSPRRAHHDIHKVKTVY